MPHFNAYKVVILKEEDVPEGYTLKEIYEAIENKQLPLKIKRGAIGIEVGQVIRSYLGRDAIVADIGFDPEFTLIVDKKLVPSEEEPDVEDLITVVKHLEWGL